MLAVHVDVGSARTRDAVVLVTSGKDGCECETVRKDVAVDERHVDSASHEEVELWS